MINKVTDNKSFIDMWRFLQDKNIENNTFMLQLNDDTLKDFKISDLKKDMTKEARNELIDRIYLECKNNIWFFFREIVRIPNLVSLYNHNDNEEVFTSDYFLTMKEMEMIYLFDHNISFLTRRNGVWHDGVKTTLLLLELYSLVFKNKNFMFFNDLDYFTEEEYSIKELVSANYQIIPFNHNDEYNKKYLSAKKAFGIDAKQLDFGFIHNLDFEVNYELLYPLISELRENTIDNNVFGYTTINIRCGNTSSRITNALSQSLFYELNSIDTLNIYKNLKEAINTNKILII